MAIGDSMDDIFNDIFGGELASKLDLSLFFSYIVINKNSYMYYNFIIFGCSMSYFFFFSSFNLLAITYFYFYLFIFSIVSSHPLLESTTNEPIEGESTSK